jgi:formamidopyrimidine-DNA glycosylase
LIASTRRKTIPEFPEVEAARQALDEPLARSPVAKAGPAHVATLKTFDPPLAELEGRRFEGAKRRGKHLFFPTDDGDLSLHVHLMSAGRIRFLEPGAKGPKTPAFRLRLEDGGELILTEGGPKKRARVGVYRPEELEVELAHLGPEANLIEAAELGEIARREARRLHPFLRDQRALAGIGRAWSNEILNRAKLSPYALTTDLGDEEIERLAMTIRELLAEGLALRLAGASDAKAYKVHNRLGEPCPNCATPLARVDFEEHTIFYCPECQTGGRVLKDRRLSRLLR